MTRRALRTYLRTWLTQPVAAAATVGLLALPLASASAATRPSTGTRDQRPTVVLVHGAWADASSWSGVISRLNRAGLTSVAVANPLRSLSGDSAYLRRYLDTIDGPIVLVGHSYGAAVITNAATGDPDVKALVYVNGSVPDEGLSVASLAGPDSALSVPDPTTVFDFVPATLPPDASSDVYLKRSTFTNAFATGLRHDQASVLAATQRPITLGALNEPSGPPAWRTIPSWYLIGTQDRVIPASAQKAMADRAGSTISWFRAGHLGLVTQPKAVANVIVRAAASLRQRH
jgi:pimeloyl-ACP methyl ester carboxylesterase